ncbi:MAG: nucleotidyltransferase domain-containing protein [Acetobacteraceae bacterium]
MQRAGIRRLSLFGSIARGDAEAGSDGDLAAEFDPAARMDLFRLTALERRIAEILGRRVDLLPNRPRNRACGPTSIGIVVLPSSHDPADCVADIIEKC